MPELDGIETLKELKRRFPAVNAVMVSAFTQNGAQITMKALEKGAFDFIAKPDSKSITENIARIKKQLKPIINVLSVKYRLNSNKGSNPSLSLPEKLPVSSNKATLIERSALQVDEIRNRMARLSGSSDIKAVAVGISTGGPNALTKVIPRLPRDFKVPVFIVQHMPPVFTEALASSLNQKSNVEVVEGKTGMAVSPGTVYIAPGGKQMKVIKTDSGMRIGITDDPRENNCCPSADYLFRSVAKCYKNNALGVIMTGMGGDGVKGLIVMKKLGARVIAQDEESSTVFGMPMEAIKAGVVDVVLPLEQIAENIISLIN
jgi:two-component system chemotaxis response regulator CheB